jgi:hypothetical protein
MEEYLYNCKGIAKERPATTKSDGMWEIKQVRVPLLLQLAHTYTIKSFKIDNLHIYVDSCRTMTLLRQEA